MAVDWLDGTVQYYEIAATAVLFYEYFAMLPDEVRLPFSGPFMVVEVDPAVVDSIRMVIKQNLGYAELSYKAVYVLTLMAG